jgi:hypothetical protein
MENETKLDLIFEWFDENFYAGKFDDCDHFLEHANLAAMSHSVLIAILTASLPAREFLPARAAFFDRVAAKIQAENPAEAAALLGGLKGDDRTLASKLRRCRARIVASGQRLLSADEISAELGRD